MKKYLTEQELFELVKNSKGEEHHIKKISPECGEILTRRYNDTICAKEVRGGMRNTSFIKKKIYHYDYPEIGIHKGIKEISEEEVLKEVEYFLINSMFGELEIYRQTDDKEEILGYIPKVVNF
jgi:hypothetical protein